MKVFVPNSFLFHSYKVYEFENVFTKSFSVNGLHFRIYTNEDLGEMSFSDTLPQFILNDMTQQKSLSSIAFHLEELLNSSYKVIPLILENKISFVVINLDCLGK